MAIDDCTRLGYAEVLADETKAVTAGFPRRANGKAERFIRTLLIEWT